MALMTSTRRLFRRDTILKLFIYGLAVHYIVLVLLYHELVDPQVVEELSVELVEEPVLELVHSVSDILHHYSFPIHGPQQQAPIRILWGISSRPEEVRERQIVRDTYLRHGRCFCSLEQHASSKDCALVYVFFVPGNAAPLDGSKLDYIEESDLVYVPPNYRWIDIAVPIALENNLEGIAWHPWNLVIVPPVLLNSLQQITNTTHVHMDSIVNATLRGCDNGATDCYNEVTSQKFSGPCVLLSLDVAQKVISHCPHATTDARITSCSLRFPNVRHYSFGQHYQVDNVSEFQQVWRQWTEQHQRYSNYSQNDNQLVYVIAKLERRSQYEYLQGIKTIMACQGIPVGNIHTYYTFPKYLLQDYRWESHFEFLHDPTVPEPMGGYFWFWKPPILWYHLQQAKDGDFIVWGSPDLWDHVRFLPDWLDAMASRHANVGIYWHHFLEVAYTKRDLYEYLCPNWDASTDETAQYHSGLIILKKTPGVMSMVEEWVRLTTNVHWINHEPSVVQPNHAEFKEHRYDQSIISLLLKCRFEERGKELFEHSLIDEMGWFQAYTFRLE